MGAADISWLGLFLGSLVLIIPIAIFLYYKTGLIKDTLWSFGRMAVQLVLVGLYLGYIFELDSIWVNLLWVLIMAVAATITIIRRSEIKSKYFALPIFNAIVFSTVLNGGIIALVEIGTQSFFNARFLIPISGMLIGNCLGSAIIGIRSFYKSLIKDEEKFNYDLACGATRNEALQPFFTDAMKEAFSPLIANTASIGLIWLPGMMTGQILGGSDPMLAIKYQVMIIVGIFVSSVLTVYLSIYGSKTFIFNEWDQFDKTSIQVERNVKKKKKLKFV